MPAFTRAELEAALAHYTTVVQRCSATGDWSPFADLFTEDVHYVEHAYGELDGREAVREWIQKVMAPFPHMRFPQGWTAYDEENGAVVMLIKNLLDHPTDPDGEPFWFPNWTRLVYAGTPVVLGGGHLQPASRRRPRGRRLAGRRRRARHRRDPAPAARLTKQS